MSAATIHPKAIVETKTIGKGSKIWAYTHVMPGARIGSDCSIGDHCFIEGDVSIGDRSTIKNGNMLWEGVVLEEEVFIGPHAFFTNDLYPRSPRMPEAGKRYENKKNWLRKTLVRRGASVGSGAVILAGITIGEYAMIAAGAVLTRDVPAHALVVGNPARPRGWVCRCGQPLRMRKGPLKCASCGLRFRKKGDGIEISV